MFDDYLLDDLDDELTEVDEEFDIWYESGPWLLLLVLPAVAMSFRKGWLFSFIFLSSSGLLIPSNQAQAFDWRDLWRTKDQQAADAFANENHELAASLFESSAWSGAANYRSKNYESAIAAFSSINTADGNYNRGNALALAGSYPEAIAAYETALSLEPNHEDALSNKAVIEKLLEQQESEKGEQQEGDSQDNQSEQNSQNESEQQETSEQQDQQSQEGNQDQQEQQQNQPPEEQEGSESNSEQNTPSESSNEELEEQQSLEQWLRRIEDDPGELLRRKFRYQYRQRQLNGTANNTSSGGQIW